MKRIPAGSAIGVLWKQCRYLLGGNTILNLVGQCRAIFHICHFSTHRNLRPRNFTLVQKFARKKLYKVLHWDNNFTQPAIVRVVCVECIWRKSSHFWGEKKHFWGWEEDFWGVRRRPLGGEKKLIESNRVRLGVRTSLAEKCCRSKNSSRTKVF